MTWNGNALTFAVFACCCLTNGLQVVCMNWKLYSEMV